jgi:hypothetical protein
MADGLLFASEAADSAPACCRARGSSAQIIEAVLASLALLLDAARKGVLQVFVGDADAAAWLGSLPSSTWHGIRF